MIVELFLIPLLFIVFAGWGCWAKLLLSVKNESIAVSIMAGLSLYGLAACIIAFFMPLNVPVEIFLLVVATIPYFLKKVRNQLPSIPITTLGNGWFWGFVLMVILAGSYYCFRSDHFGYYVPTLQWLNQFGIIIGVGNIDWSLGQMSFMHIMQAGIDQTIDPFGRFSVFIIILYLVYIFERKSFLLLLFVPFYFLYFQSASSDLPIVFFSLIVVNEIFFHYKKGDFKILFAISVFVFVIKPIGFWLPLWVLIAAFYLDKSELKSIRNYIFPSILIFIFLVKNVITSSLLLYPITFTEINTYWHPNSQILLMSNQEAAAYAYDFKYGINAANSFSFFEKIVHWLTLPDLQVVIHLTIVIITLIFGVFAFLKKQFLYITFFFVAMLKILVTLSFSGQYRFILDIIYPMIFILLFSLNLKRMLVLSVSSVLFMSALVFVSFPSLHKEIFPSFRLTKVMVGITKESLIRPDNYPQDFCKEERIGNFHIHTPLHDLYNYETPPPAFTIATLKKYYNMGIFPQRRDPNNIRKGFYMRKLSNEEKDDVRRMIENLQ